MKKTLLLLIVMLAPLATANANPIDVYFVGTHYGASVGTLLTTVDGNYDRTGYVGEIKLSWSENKANPFVGYCLTLSETLDGVETVEVRPLTDLPDSGNPPYAENNAGPKLAWLLNQYAFGVDSNNEGAALQIALWEVLYDSGPGYNLLGGDFRITSHTDPSDPIYLLAFGYLANIGSSQAIWLDSGSRPVTGGAYNQVGQDYGVPVSAPEPASLLLLGTGLSALGLAAWRRRKQ